MVAFGSAAILAFWRFAMGDVGAAAPNPAKGRRPLTLQGISSLDPSSLRADGSLLCKKKRPVPVTGTKRELRGTTRFGMQRHARLPPHNAGSRRRSWRRGCWGPEPLAISPAPPFSPWAALSCGACAGLSPSSPVIAVIISKTVPSVKGQFAASPGRSMPQPPLRPSRRPAPSRSARRGCPARRCP